MTLRHLILTLLTLSMNLLQARTELRHWTIAEGLPTGEVQQIIELPNGQMLVNCEGVFCLSDGAGFRAVACDMGRCYQLPHYLSSYGQQWQGDSLLWLHDFYRVYLFDTHRRMFRYDMEKHIGSNAFKQSIAHSAGSPALTADQRRLTDSIGLTRRCTTALTDRQGGLWMGTRTNGIFYLPPRRHAAKTLPGSHPMVDRARSYVDRQGRIWRCKNSGLECVDGQQVFTYNKHNVRGLPHTPVSFITQIDSQRYLLCDSVSTLGYFYPGRREFHTLHAKLPALNAYRHFVGACQSSGKTFIVYTQNGCFQLDTQADTISRFAPAATIERNTTKYNCMLRDGEGRLWIGTQNGLFEVQLYGQQGQLVNRVNGLLNQCIRSLVMDSGGHVWAGTASGIARITPSVVNLGPEDGVPAATTTMERAACLTHEGNLTFVTSMVQGLMFNPDSLFTKQKPPVVVITGGRADKQELDLTHVDLPYDINNIELSFSTLDYAAPTHTRYRHRLLPVEKQWSDSNDGSGAGKTAYTALAPGNYIFQAQAIDANGQWGPVTRQAIIIRPPLWLTWWAKTLYALIIASVAMALINYYLKKRKEKIERDNDERINRLFELREKAQHRFAQSVNVNPEKLQPHNEKERLVGQLMKAIGENMDNVDYTIDHLARDVAMSRATLYKKMQAMLDITPNEFLRNVRLKHAAVLLTETETPVSQIALMVGFLTPRYFSQCFRQMFGVTPSEYRGENKTTATT